MSNQSDHPPTASSKRGRPSIKKAGLFSKDLKSMMYAFGDESPSTDSISVMEDILTDYITDLCTESARTAYPRTKVKIDDFKFVLRRDAKKLGRVEELLGLQKEIASAKKLFNEDELDRKNTSDGVTNTQSTTGKQRAS